MQEENNEVECLDNICNLEINHGYNVDSCDEPPCDEDHWKVCDECEVAYHGDCVEHGPLIHIKDKPVEPNSKTTNARSSLPDIVYLDQSSIPNAGTGVFAKEKISSGVCFGPYIGHHHKAKTEDSNYEWEIRKNDSVSHYIDAKDETKSNWLRFINCARFEKEQNLLAFQYHGEVYYRTYRAIEPGQELLVWYGDDFGSLLRLSDQGERSTRSMRTGNGCKVTGEKKEVTTRNNGALEDHNLNFRLCKFCNEDIVKQDGLQELLLQRKPYGRFRCVICDVSYRCRSNIIHHGAKAHRKGEQFSCSKCGKFYNYKSFLYDGKDHFKPSKTLDQPVVCPRCCVQFPNRGDFDLHNCFANASLELKDIPTTYSCDYPDCFAIFPTLQRLNQHLLRFHSKQSKFSDYWQCKICFDDFRYQKSYLKHLKSKHDQTLLYKCPRCLLHFENTVDLYRHTGPCKKSNGSRSVSEDISFIADDDAMIVNFFRSNEDLSTQQKASCNLDSNENSFEKLNFEEFLRNGIHSVNNSSKENHNDNSEVQQKVELSKLVRNLLEATSDGSGDTEESSGQSESETTNVLILKHFKTYLNTEHEGNALSDQQSNKPRTNRMTAMSKDSTCDLLDLKDTVIYNETCASHELSEQRQKEAVIIMSSVVSNASDTTEDELCDKKRMDLLESPDHVISSSPIQPLYHHGQTRNDASDNPPCTANCILDTKLTELNKMNNDIYIHSTDPSENTKIKSVSSDNYIDNSRFGMGYKEYDLSTDLGSTTNKVAEIATTQANCQSPGKIQNSQHLQILSPFQEINDGSQDLEKLVDGLNEPNSRNDVHSSTNDADTNAEYLYCKQRQTSSVDSGFDPGNNNAHESNWPCHDNLFESPERDFTPHNDEVSRIEYKNPKRVAQYADSEISENSPCLPEKISRSVDTMNRTLSGHFQENSPNGINVNDVKTSKEGTEVSVQTSRCNQVCIISGENSIVIPDANYCKASIRSEDMENYFADNNTIDQKSCSTETQRVVVSVNNGETNENNSNIIATTFNRKEDDMKISAISQDCETQVCNNQYHVCNNNKSVMSIDDLITKDMQLKPINNLLDAKPVSQRRTADFYSGSNSGIESDSDIDSETEDVINSAILQFMEKNTDVCDDSLDVNDQPNQASPDCSKDIAVLKPVTGQASIRNDNDEKVEVSKTSLESAGDAIRSDSSFDTIQHHVVHHGDVSEQFSAEKEPNYQLPSFNGNSKIEESLHLTKNNEILSKIERLGIRNVGFLELSCISNEMKSFAEQPSVTKDLNEFVQINEQQNIVEMSDKKQRIDAIGPDVNQDFSPFEILSSLKENDVNIDTDLTTLKGDGDLSHTLLEYDGMSEMQHTCQEMSCSEDSVQSPSISTAFCSSPAKLPDSIINSTKADNPVSSASLSFPHALSNCKQKILDTWKSNFVEQNESNKRTTTKSQKSTMKRRTPIGPILGFDKLSEIVKKKVETKHPEESKGSKTELHKTKRTDNVDSKTSLKGDISNKVIFSENLVSEKPKKRKAKSIEVKIDQNKKPNMNNISDDNLDMKNDIVENEVAAVEEISIEAQIDIYQDTSFSPIVQTDCDLSTIDHDALKELTSQGFNRYQSSFDTSEDEDSTEDDKELEERIEEKRAYYILIKKEIAAIKKRIAAKRKRKAQKCRLLKRPAQFNRKNVESHDSSRRNWSHDRRRCKDIPSSSHRILKHVNNSDCVHRKLNKFKQTKLFVNLYRVDAGQEFCSHCEKYFIIKPVVVAVQRCR